ncbi:MAG: Cupredoxin-like domain [Thermoanaerobaculia bacterium]|nr:Cupredoxin-like domain [Thermoanaerobaculia bacterium]
MRLRHLAFFALLFATAASAKEVWLSIGGSVGTFRTDARIFNPSTTKDITLQAYYLPEGNGDNSSVQPLTITVPKRQMLVYNDVVSSLFHASGLGAIRIVSSDDFVATQRIYAAVPTGTLGQFVGGVDATAAKAKGVIIQLQSGGSFRTNIGAANPNSSTANVTWRLYDRSNALVGTAKTIAMPPYAVIKPSSYSFFIDSLPGSVDLTDSWISYSSDQPIVAYGSVIDNGTTDPTYIPAAEDTGVTVVAPTGNIFNVTTRTSSIAISPAITQGLLQPGDKVTFRFSGHDTTHGFRLVDAEGHVVVDVTVPPDAAVFERTVTLDAEGTYLYYCTITTCSPGHLSMQGTFPVGTPAYDPGPKY